MPVGDILSALVPVPPALNWNPPLSVGSGFVRAVWGRDSIAGAASLSRAFVRAENFIIGSEISSSELSFREYVLACVGSAVTGSLRDNCGLAKDGLKFCLEAGRRSDAKWEEPIGVGDAMAITFWGASCWLIKY